jgi:hypothetical protein
LRLLLLLLLLLLWRLPSTRLQPLQSAHTVQKQQEGSDA